MNIIEKIKNYFNDQIFQGDSIADLDSEERERKLLNLLDMLSTIVGSDNRIVSFIKSNSYFYCYNPDMYMPEYNEKTQIVINRQLKDLIMQAEIIFCDTNKKISDYSVSDDRSINNQIENMTIESLNKIPISKLFKLIGKLNISSLILVFGLFASVATVSAYLANLNSIISIKELKEDLLDKNITIKKIKTTNDSLIHEISLKDKRIKELETQATNKK